MAQEQDKGLGELVGDLIETAETVLETTERITGEIAHAAGHTVAAARHARGAFHPEGGFRILNRLGHIGEAASSFNALARQGRRLLSTGQPTSSTTVDSQSPTPQGK